MKIKKEHISELNILRTLAFGAVVLQHVLGIYRNNPNVYPAESITMAFVFVAAKFAVPMFIFISGMVLFYNYYEKLKYPQFIIKRAKEILLPYAVWTLVYNLYFGRHSLSLRWSTLKDWCKDLLLGTGAYHLWYVVMIFQLYLFLPIIVLLCKAVQRKSHSKTWLVIWLGSFTGVYLLLLLIPSYVIPHGYFMPHNKMLRFIMIDFTSRNSLYYIFYFILGGVAGLTLPQWRQCVKRFSPLIFAAFIVLFVPAVFHLLQIGYINGKINLVLASTLTPFMCIYTTVSLLALYSLSLLPLWKHAGLQKLTNLIGKHSYQAYLMHALVLDVITHLMYRWFPQANRVILYSTITLICFAVSILGAWTLRFCLSTCRQLASHIGKSLNHTSPNPPAA